ncbi:MAG: spore cortex biosynthesis protein YabQ [Clostridia bacterium]|nr:spore cortex biosynthesis protein YabQ [Clostridia bacterium]
MVPVVEQFHSFFFTVAVGLLMGIIIDAYRSFGYRRRPGFLVTVAGDLLLWLFLTGLVFFLLLLNNWGEVRAYVLIGMALGFLIYRKWFSAFMLRLWHRIFFVIGRIFKITLFLVLFPVKLLQKILFLPLGLISMALDWVTRMLALGARKAGIRPRRWMKNLFRRWGRNKNQ